MTDAEREARGIVYYQGNAWDIRGNKDALEEMIAEALSKAEVRGATEAHKHTPANFKYYFKEGLLRGAEILHNTKLEANDYGLEAFPKQMYEVITMLEEAIRKEAE